jgi:hypothetical protein
VEGAGAEARVSSAEGGRAGGAYMPPLPTASGLGQRLAGRGGAMGQRL